MLAGGGSYEYAQIGYAKIAGGDVPGLLEKLKTA
jgi:hypothetical protein